MPAIETPTLPDAPAATPETTAAETPSTPSPATQGGAEDFSEFDTAMDRVRGKPAKPKEEKKPEGDEPAEPKVEKPEEGKTTDKPKDDKATGPKALREQYEKLTAEHKSTQAKIAEYEKKIQEAEAKGKDTTTLAEKLAATVKELDEHKAELRALKQEASPEFKEKYEKPFNQAAMIAQKQIERLMVTDPSTGEQRRAEWKDFVALYESAVREDGVIDFDKTEALFGKGAGVVTQHLTRLLEKNQEKEMAFEEEKASWATKAKEREAQEIQRREAMQSMQQKLFKEVEDKNPDFADDPEDTEGTKLLQEGRALVRTQPRTEQEHALLNAQIFHRAAAYDRMKHKTAKQAERIAELESQVEELRGSAPGKTKRQGETTTPAPPKGFADGLREALGE